MNVYSRALRYIDMNDVKQKHHQKLAEKKILEEKKNELMEELRYKNSPLYSNWRCEITEGMTTDALITTTTLPATGDEVLATQNGDTLSGDSPEGFFGIGSDSEFAVPENVDTMVFNVSTVGVGQLQMITSKGNFYGPFGSGSHTVTLKSSDINSNSTFFWYVSNGTATTGFGTWVIDSFIEFQRKTPITVFVPLDSPEATSFIRTGSGDLSKEEKEKKLKEMLEASDEYVKQMYGDKFPGSGAVPPGEAGTTPGVQTIDYGNDLTPLSSNPYGTEVGQVAGTYDLIKSGQVPYMNPDKAKQILNDPKYQQLWDDDPDALKAVQKLVKGV